MSLLVVMWNDELLGHARILKVAVNIVVGFALESEIFGFGSPCGSLSRSFTSSIDDIPADRLVPGRDLGI